MTEVDQQIIKKVSQLITLFREGKIKLLEKHEMHPILNKGSRENYLYFTLAPALNFQRNSPAFWESAYHTFVDTETQWVFFPEQVVQRSLEELQSALLKHKLALQRNKHPKIWQNIACTIANYYNNDPREILKKCEWNIVKILQLIQIEQKKSFPYLSGLKLSNYWLFILTHFTDAKFNNLQELSIIPDTHIMQSSIQLGIVPPDATPQEVDHVWRIINKAGSFSPVELHGVLWNWSRSGFQPSIE